ncbi:MAG: hypothetical protein O9346_13780 [Leptospiraceae bacterium]|nr:hypothetical protein [Leptospiraceae bacterium]MCZ8347480.1 hypothetical protein [Leptospiraceae bacterium]
MKTFTFTSISILSWGILYFSACSMVETTPEIQTGVIVDTIMKDGKKFYRVTSTAKASSSSIEKNNGLMMATSSCDASKLLANEKLKELEPDPREREINTKLMGTLTPQNGRYCTKEFHYPYAR